MVLHILFAVSGVASVLIGPLLPIMAARLSLSDLDVTYFFQAQFAGSLTGTLLTRPFGRRSKYILAAMIGSVMMAAGILLMNAVSFELCIAGFLLNGIGIGLTLPSINTIIIALNPMRSAAALSFLNFGWGVGAIFSKPMVDLLSFDGWILPFSLSLAIPLVGCAAALIGAQDPSIAGPNEEAGGSSEKGSVWRHPLAWLFAAINFLHVGFEGGMGGWLPAFAERNSISANNIFSPSFLFFLFFVLGRGSGSLVLRYVQERTVILISIAVALAGSIMVVLSSSSLLLSVGAAIAGLGTSVIFPTHLGRFARRLGPEALKNVTPYFVCGTLGAATATWCIGFLSEYFRDLRSAMWFLPISLALLIVLTLFTGRQHRAEAPLSKN